MKILSTTLTVPLLLLSPQFLLRSFVLYFAFVFPLFFLYVFAFAFKQRFNISFSFLFSLYPLLFFLHLAFPQFPIRNYLIFFVVCVLLSILFLTSPGCFYFFISPPPFSFLDYTFLAVSYLFQDFIPRLYSRYLQINSQ